jgi:hypothetical protein
VGCYAAYIGITDVSGQLLVNSSRVESKKNFFLTLEEGTDSRPETSVIYYQSTLRNIPEEGSLKSHKTGLISTHQHYLVSIRLLFGASLHKRMAQNVITSDKFIRLTKLAWERACVHVYELQKVSLLHKCSVDSSICSAVPLLLPHKLYRTV